MRPVQVVAVVPAWMLADGEYVGLGVGDRAVLGFALAVTAVHDDLVGAALTQSGEQPALTTLRGRTACPTDGGRGPTVLHAAGCSVVLFAGGRIPVDADLAVTGWLTAEPYLWAADGELARAVPEGRQEWTVRRVRAVDEGTRELDRLPDEADVDHETAYLLDLTPG